MKKTILWFLLFLNIIFNSSCNSHSRTFYLDAVDGADTNNGLSPKGAWRTMVKIKEVRLAAGDKILFKGGQTFIGSLKLEYVFGKVGLPVLISTYGGNRAMLYSGDSTAVLVKNCEFVVVKNLILFGSGRLHGNNSNGGDFSLCSNLNVDSLEASGYLFSGIQVTGGKNIRMTNVYAHDNGFCGIHVTSDQTGRDNSPNKTVRNVYIGHSVAKNNPGCPAIKNNHSGNGILVGGVTNGLIEYCEAMNNGWDMPREGNGPVGIWIYMSDSVVIQHCYSHHNKTSTKGADGGGFDFDGGVTNSILQYNLSLYNEGAGYGMFQYAGAKAWNNNIVRYNISYHDGIKNGQSGIFMWCDPAAIPMKNLHSYNNTVVNKYGHGVNFLPGLYENFVFENNIFLITDSTDEFTGGEFTGASFDKNLYWNSFNSHAGLKQPKIRLDANPVVSDPMILMRNSDALENLNSKTINSIAYFNLKHVSPALKSGKLIEKNGVRDYWGNEVSNFEKPNIGADGTSSYSSGTEWISTTENDAWIHENNPVISRDKVRFDAAVDTSATLQTIEGFGACFNELGWTSLKVLSEYDRNAILKELFEPDFGANFNICRMPVGANDFSLDWYSYNETEGDFKMKKFSIENDNETLIPFIKSAANQNPKLKIWASPWSPPSWMKWNKHYACAVPNGSLAKNFQNNLPPDRQGKEGTNMFIQEDKYFQAYALYFSKFIEEYKKQGIHISMVMPQNEFNSCQIFPSCTWTVYGLATFIGKYLGPAMEKQSVELMFGTMERPAEALVDTIINDPLAGKYIKGVGFQWAGKDAIPGIHKRYPDMKLYQTEQECGDGKNDWKHCLHVWNLMKHYIKNGTSAYLYWNISLAEGGYSRWGWQQNSLISVDTLKGTFRYNHEFYLLKHVSHYVKPGAKLLQTEGPFNELLAFKNPDKSVVIVAFNNSNEPRELTLKIGNETIISTTKANSFNTIFVKK
ncbi:MAG: right-handed parallel beta-helix repeat-containing protein [Prolixibacteraceae bacterium]